MLHDAQTRRTQLERDVEQDVRRSLMTLQNAESRVGVATENVQVAEEALTVARDRRAAGYGSPVEVDRAQDAYRQAHEDLIAAQADAAAAQFDYEHATGRDSHATSAEGRHAIDRRAAVTSAAAMLNAAGGSTKQERKPVNKWLVTVSITFGTLMGAIDASIVNVAVPHLTGSLGVTIEQITWVTPASSSPRSWSCR